MGEDALHFGRWFFKSKFALMESFLGELREGAQDQDAREVYEDRFLRATRHANRVLVARAVVTVLLALGVIAAAAAGTAKWVWLPTLVATNVTFWLSMLDRVAAVAGAASFVLLLARLAFDRYLDLVNTTVTFLAIEIATCSRASSR